MTQTTVAQQQEEEPQPAKTPAIGRKFGTAPKAPVQVQFAEDGSTVTITVPVHNPRRSKTGHTLVIADTGGNFPSGLTTEDGQPIFVNVNVYYETVE
jgi:hypothetical protein